MNEMMTNSVAEQVRGAFNFTVEKFPLTGPDGMRTPHYGLFRSDNGQCVAGAVSGRYVPHTTDDVLALVEAAGSVFGGTAAVQTHFDDGHYVTIQPSREYRLSVFGSRDNVFPRLILDAPYGGTGSFTGTVGLFRDLCRNLSRLRSVSSATVSVIHNSNLRSRMDELRTTFASLDAGWQNLSLVIRQMEDRRVRMVDFLNAVYGEPGDRDGRSLTMHKNRTEAIFNRLLRERVQSGRGDIGNDFVVSGWEAWNAVQGYVQHDKTRRGSPSEMDRVVRSLHDASVARAERLVFEMAV